MREQILRAIRMAEAGLTNDALWLLRDVVNQDTQQVAAWKWLAYLTPDPNEALRAVRWVIRLDPADQWAVQALPVLEQRLGVLPPVPRQRRATRRSRRTSTVGFVTTVLGVTVAVLVIALAVFTLVFWRQFTALAEQAAASSLFQPTATVESTAAALEPAPATTIPSPVVEPPPTQPELPPTDPPVVEPSIVAPGEGPASVALVPEVLVSTDTTTYTFQAATVSEIQQALYNQGPKLDSGESSIAMTTYQIWVEWTALQSPSSCQMSEATIHLDVLYTFPQWQPAGSPDPSLYDEWNRFIEYVVAHEEHHAEIAQGCARALADQLTALPPTGVCSALESQINATIDTTYSACEQQQAAYDQAEGRTTFPLP